MERPVPQDEGPGPQPPEFPVGQHGGKFRAFPVQPRSIDFARQVDVPVAAHRNRTRRLAALPPIPYEGFFFQRGDFTR